jgi:6-phosphogluconolactonase
MRIGKWARLFLAAAPLLAGCGNFWQAPGGGSGSSSFTLSNSGAITVAPGSSNTSTITVTPASSFTGTVSLSCAITSSPSSANNPTTCSLSPTSVTITDTTAQTSTLTATTTASTTTGAYQVTVTGTSGTVSETTNVCVVVTTSTGSCSSATGTSGVFYVLDQTTTQIVSMNIASGKLTGTSYTLPAEPLAIAVAPNGKFLYVSTVAGIYLYTIGSNGALTVGNGGSVISQDPANTMQVDSTNNWLVDAVSGTNELFAIAINSSTGVLTNNTEQAFPGGLPVTTPTQLVISPNDSSSCNSCYVFVAMGNGGTELINFNPANANPFGNSSGTIKLVNASGGDNTVAVDPSNRLLYIGETVAVSGTQTGGLRAFTISSSGVTPISGSPYSSQGTGPSSILPSADGNFVYVANEAVSGISTGNIASFSVSTSSLTPITTATAGPSGQIRLAEDSTGGYLLAVDFAGNPDLQIFTMSSGTLTSVLSTNTGTDPVGAIAIAAAP